MEVAALAEADFRTNPLLFIELAQAWAGGGNAPEARHELCLRDMPRPLILDVALAGEALWGIFSCPERGRALTWLDRMRILEEILPVWAGNPERRALRLNAVEEVHRERWAGGLGRVAYEWLCVYQGQKVGRLGGWAITSLATLLLEGEEPVVSFAGKVRHDLKVMGARPDAVDRIVLSILEYAELRELMLEAKPHSGRSYSPTAVVAALSSLMAMPELSMHDLRGAIHEAEQLLLRHAAPESGPRRRQRDEE